MASRKRGRSGLVLLLLVLIAAALAGGYAWAWFHYAGELRTAAVQSLARLSIGDRQAECPDMHTGGFPLSLQLSCTRFSYRDPGKGVAVETGPVRSAARVYDPLGIDSAFEGPTVVAWKGMPPILLDWASLTADTRLAQPLPEHVALAGSDIIASSQDGGRRLLHVGTARLDARPEKTDLALVLAFGSLAIDESLTPGFDLPPLDGEARIVVDNGVALLARPPQSLRGLSSNVRNATLSSGEARITVSGPVAVNPNGLLNARLTVAVHRPREIAALLGDALPRMRDQIETAFSALAMLGENTTLPLTIKNGEASIGFIKIGKVPPIQ